MRSVPDSNGLVQHLDVFQRLSTVLKDATLEVRRLLDNRGRLVFRLTLRSEGSMDNDVVAEGC